VEYLRRVASPLFFLLLMASCATAQDVPSYRGLWDEAFKQDACAPKEFPDFILGECPDKLTFWYFTKPSHPAHPGVIKRWAYKAQDGWHIQEHGLSFAPDSKQQAFKDWLAQIHDLDRQMKDYIAKKKPTQPN
jgi:hypothetical protein